MVMMNSHCNLSLRYLETLKKNLKFDFMHTKLGLGDENDVRDDFGKK